MVIDGMKVCGKCKIAKPVETEFYHVNRASGDGYHGYCKPCLKAHVIAWQKANPEKKAANDRKYDQLPSRKAKMPGWAKNYRDRNKEKLAELNRKWAKANPEKIAAKTARYRANNPEKVVESQRKYHQSMTFKQIHADRERLRRGILKVREYEGGRDFEYSGKLSLKEWAELITTFNFGCAYCGKLEDKPTIEHMTPLSRGGNNELGNIVPACAECNYEKNDLTLEEYGEVKGLDVADIKAKALLH